jgi:outer membrane lipoprotein-sorting protein
MIKRTVILQVCCILFTSLVILAFKPAYDIKTDLLKMQEFYKKHSHLSLTVQVEMIDAASGKTNANPVSGIVKRNGNLFYNSFDNIETIVNENYYLVVDHARKRITCDKPTAYSQQQDIASDYPSVIDTLLKYTKVTFLRTEKNVKWYSFPGSKMDQFSKIEIGLHKEGYLQGLVYHFPGDDEELAEIVRISYSDINTHSAFSEKQFSEKKYISHSGKKVTPAAAFKDYKIINKLLIYK